MEYKDKGLERLTGDIGMAVVSSEIVRQVLTWTWWLLIKELVRTTEGTSTNSRRDLIIVIGHET